MSILNVLFWTISHLTLRAPCSGTYYIKSFATKDEHCQTQNCTNVRERKSWYHHACTHRLNRVTRRLQLGFTTRTPTETATTARLRAATILVSRLAVCWLSCGVAGTTLSSDIADQIHAVMGEIYTSGGGVTIDSCATEACPKGFYSDSKTADQCKPVRASFQSHRHCVQ